MTYNRVGVFGSTGLLGSEVTRALVEEGFDVVPFSRIKTTVAGIVTQELGSLVGFDVVVATVGHTGMKEQIDLIQRAKRDGVKRFVPSEFGIDPDSAAAQAPFFQPKVDVFRALENANFPDGWTALSSGFFDSVIGSFVRTDLQSSTITVSGDGNVTYPFTVRHDLGRVLAHTFKHPSQFENTWLRIANGWLTLNEIAEIIREKTDRNLRVKQAELDGSTPVLQLLEKSGWNTFDRTRQTKDLPLQLASIRDYIGR
ncbi:hypothetical protein N7494_000505 [Penicillium frequentans]|uniref:NmrA-like domain-containing protein n=1 Tax=Penicillium frequentans TaxID=3151616 RepID=A0AAD6D7X3_9EURO|nr:hypothetical protein N7494_000505 [Penicillium glabrum]